MVWAPGDPWPGSPGGAAHESWGGYIRLYLQAAIAAGKPFTLGDHPNDRLNGGNVLTLPAAGERALATGLWVDLSCDLTELEVTLGSSAGEGILSKAEAGTLQATLYDPEAKYDPLNPDTPYALAGRTRLIPGVLIHCWAEIVTGPTGPFVAAHPLFTGTVDRWEEPWVTDPSERFATVTATDVTKTWARFDKPAIAAVGSGDSTMGRLSRLKTHYGWGGNISQAGSSTILLQSTTLAQPGWELVNRVADDEIGFAYFVPQVHDSIYPDGQLRMVNRDVWTSRPAPSVTIGCGDGMYDVAVEAVPASFDEQLKNAAYVSRSGGVQQTARVQSSIDRFYEQSLNRSDLGLLNDTMVATWAQTIVNLYAYPQTTLDSVTLRPDVAPQSWLAWWNVLNIALVSTVVRVLWESAGYTVDVELRVIGWTHTITTDAWEIEWRTLAAGFSSTAGTFHLGPHAQDLLDAGYVLA